MNAGPGISPSGKILPESLFVLIVLISLDLVYNMSEDMTDAGDQPAEERPEEGFDSMPDFQDKLKMYYQKYFPSKQFYRWLSYGNGKTDLCGQFE